jgi:gluconokinase
MRQSASMTVTLVVMGVSGVGKSSVAAELVRRTGWVFVEGDNLHPESNRAKMAAGIPLDDDDRWPWLRRVAAWIGEQEAADRSAVVTCCCRTVTPPCGSCTCSRRRS